MQLVVKWILTGLIPLWASLSLSGCTTGVLNAGAGGGAEVNASLPAGSVVDSAQRLSMVYNNGSNYVTYFNSENQLILKTLKADSAPIVVSDAGKDNAVLRVYADVTAQNEHLYMAWMEKNTKPVEKKERTGEKYINFSATNFDVLRPAAAQRISNGGGAFEPHIATGPQGGVYVVWTDERNGGANDIYVNVSSNHGATWLSKEVKLTDAKHLFVIDPVVEVVGNRVVVQWAQVDEKDVHQIMSRSSEDQGATWTSPVTVYKGSNQLVSPQMIRVGEKLTACWAAAVGVMCTNSTDAGGTWSAMTKIEGTDRVGLIKAKADSKGRIHVLVNQRSEDGTKAALFYTHDDGVSNFKPAKLLSREPAYQAKALEPTLAIGENDTLLAAWMDHTFIKPMVSATYSTDGGTSWSAPTIVNYSWNFEEQYFPTAVANAAGTFEFAYLRTKPGNSYWELSNINPAVDKVDFDPKPKIDRLPERVKKYWKTRIDKKWAESFEFLDPYYRRISDKKAYVESQGRVTYYSYAIKGDPEVNGVRATVPVAYESEVPEFMLKGKPVTLPRREITAMQKWVWIDAEWYLVLEGVTGHNSLPD